MTDNLDKLFKDTIKDVYNAEKQFFKGMGKFAKAAQDPGLKQSIDSHRKETEGHIERLERVAAMIGIKPTGKVCKAAQGLIEEGDEHLEEVESGPVLDAAIILCAQKNEHYEICSYGTLIAWAKQLGLKNVVPILESTLEEEKGANEKLSQAAESKVNQEAMASKVSVK